MSELLRVATPPSHGIADIPSRITRARSPHLPTELPNQILHCRRNVNYQLACSFI